MKLRFLLPMLFVLCFYAAEAQRPVRNLVIVTLDGFRWQELFEGMQDSLLINRRFTMDSSALWSKFGGASPGERRRRLMPFFWNTIVAKGQAHGNRDLGSRVDVLNPYRFSYPGYNEIFTGYPDTLVNSNNKVPNANLTVLEFLNQQPTLKGRVAAFCSWKVFDAIFNEARCGFPVSAGFDSVPIKNPRFDLISEMQRLSFQPFDEDIRPDMLTYFAAKEYLLRKKPRVLYIGFDETDDYAHEGKYDHYLNAVHLTDRFLEDLWNTLQSLPEYRNNTTLVITSDHGRGRGDRWTGHGADYDGASEIWFAALGPGIRPQGEVQASEQLFQAQLAQTFARLLGFWFTANHPVADAIPGLAR